MLLRCIIISFHKLLGLLAYLNFQASAHKLAKWPLIICLGYSLANKIVVQLRPKSKTDSCALEATLLSFSPVKPSPRNTSNLKPVSDLGSQMQNIGKYETGTVSYANRLHLSDDDVHVFLVVYKKAIFCAWCS